MVPEKQLVFVHFDHYGSVTSTFNEDTQVQQILNIFYGLIHLNPMRIVARLEQSTHFGWTNL
jgi:hypothetical protein